METQNNKDIILIENYLDGKLSEEEKNCFLQQMESDPEFAKLYRFRLKIRNDWQKAQQYKAARQQVVDTVRKAKYNKRRKVIYAVAASLTLLVIVSGVFTIVNQHQNSSRIVSIDSDSTQVETHEPQLKKPESYANSGRYNPEAEAKELFLSFTFENDSLVFNWHPITDGESDLVVISQESENELFRKKIMLSDQVLSINRDKLPPGKLVWYIEGFAGRDSIQLKK